MICLFHFFQIVLKLYKPIICWLLVHLAHSDPELNLKIHHPCSEQN